MDMGMGTGIGTRIGKEEDRYGDERDDQVRVWVWGRRQGVGRTGMNMGTRMKTWKGEYGHEYSNKRETSFSRNFCICMSAICGGMHFIFPRRGFCNSSSTSWRACDKTNKLVYTVSSILLQRINWNSILRSINLSSYLTQSLFLHILNRTQINPQISIDFFNWTKTSLGFRPNLTSVCTIIDLAARSANLSQVRPHLSSAIHSVPADSVLKTMVGICGDKQTLSRVFNFVVQVYAEEDLLNESLGLYSNVKKLGFDFIPSTSNALLSSLIRSDRTKSALCFYCSMIRCSNVMFDDFTLELVARIMWRLKKLKVLESMLIGGIRSSFVYGLVIDLQCHIGDFVSVFDNLSKMKGMMLDLEFETCSSLLNGACKHRDDKIIKYAMKMMEERGFIFHNAPEYDVIITKLCCLGKSYAAEMFFSRASVENAWIESGTYGHMLTALSKDGRRKEAIGLYKTISEKKIVLADSLYSSFIDVICEGVPSEETRELLKRIIAEGNSSCRSNVSKFVTSLCGKGMWREAEDFLNDVIKDRFLPESFCCCALMNYYCRSKKLDAAILFHDSIENLQGKLDTPTYNAFLGILLAGKRIDKAEKIFNYMRKCDMLSAKSFVVMIKGFCSVHHKRKAMDLHDEMLRLGIMPNKKSYRQLISRFH